MKKLNATKKYDVLIIGVSYAGLSAALALGRAIRKVLIIDNGNPCNIQTPFSHNFLTQDGKAPQELSKIAKQQLSKSPTIDWYDGSAIASKKIGKNFMITTHNNHDFLANILIFATGVKDIMPNINGFSECWGISVIHCPYCHGYEVKNIKTGILANGNAAFHYAQLIRNWTKDLTIFTNGTSILTTEQKAIITKHNIAIVEKKINTINHFRGNIKQLIFSDNTTHDITALYNKPDFEQHCNIPKSLGCEITEQGHIKVDMFQKTTIENVFACGDNTSNFRSVAFAVASGNITGAVVNTIITEKEFV